MRSTSPIHQRVIDGLLSATTAAFAAIPGIAPTMTSNWALIAWTAGSSGRRCSDSTVSSAPASVARSSEADSSALPDPDQGDGHDRHGDDGEQDAEQDEQVGVAHDSPYPSVRAFM